MQSPWEEVRAEMVNEKGLDPAAADRIGEFVQLSGGVELADKLTLGKCSVTRIDFIHFDLIALEDDPDTHVTIIEFSTGDLGEKSKGGLEGLTGMKTFLKYCELFGCADVVSFDLSLARGLDYYTGIIYEAVLLGDNKDAKGEPIQVGSPSAHYP